MLLQSGVSLSRPLEEEEEVEEADFVVSPRTSSNNLSFESGAGAGMCGALLAPICVVIPSLLISLEIDWKFAPWRMHTIDFLCFNSFSPLISRSAHQWRICPDLELETPIVIRSVLADDMDPQNDCIVILGGLIILALLHFLLTALQLSTFEQEANYAPITKNHQTIGKLEDAPVQPRIQDHLEKSDRKDPLSRIGLRARLTRSSSTRSVGSSLTQRMRARICVHATPSVQSTRSFRLCRRRKIPFRKKAHVIPSSITTGAFDTETQKRNNSFPITEPVIDEQQSPHLDLPQCLPVKDGSNIPCRTKNSSESCCGVEPINTSQSRSGTSFSYLCSCFLAGYSWYCFRSSTFWPKGLGGAGMTSEIWNLSDNDSESRVLRQYIFGQAIYSVYAAIHSFMCVAIVLSKANMQKFFVVSGCAKHFFLLGCRHILVVGATTSAYFLPSLRRLCAVGFFSKDLSDVSVSIWKVCVGRKSSRIVPILLNLVVWPVLWISLKTESGEWLNELGEQIGVESTQSAYMAGQCNIWLFVFIELFRLYNS